jgi:hypothetical protein
MQKPQNDDWIPTYQIANISNLHQCWIYVKGNEYFAPQILIARWHSKNEKFYTDDGFRFDIQEVSHFIPLFIPDPPKDLV